MTLSKMAIAQSAEARARLRAATGRGDAEEGEPGAAGGSPVTSPEPDRPGPVESPGPDEPTAPVSTAGGSALDAYVERTRPEWLRADEPPESWRESPAAWTLVLAEARAAHRSASALAFAAAVAVRGWRSHEAATGVLDGDALGVSNSGHVSRRDAAGPQGLHQRAGRVLRDAAALRPDPLAGLTRIMIEQISHGAFSASSAAQVEEGERLVAAALAAQRAEAQTGANRPVVSVPARFRGVGGRWWAAGTYPVEPADLAELEKYRSAMELQAAERGWDRPMHNGPWPPFTLVEPAVPVTAVPATGDGLW